MTAGAPFEADYVVIGSGAGGAPVATRLAARGRSVIVIEAGGPPEDDLAYSVPAFHAYASESPTMAWDFFVHHYDDQAQARRDDKWRPEGGGVLYPRASTVGGCTAHNAMITVCPNDSDWEWLATTLGDPSWSAGAMRPYFERVERCLYQSPGRALPRNPLLARLIRLVPGLRDLFAPSGHGFDGWLPTRLADPKLVAKDGQLLKVVASAVESELGRTLGRRLRWRERLLASFVDPNDSDSQDGSMLGVWLIPLAVDERGRRAGTRELLAGTPDPGGPPAHPRVLTDTLAASLIIDDDGRCRGVRCLRGARIYRASAVAAAEPGEPVEVLARREVILSAGAFNSPQLLKLSGIGPADELRELGIPVRLHSPGVGTNLQDRYEVGVSMKVEKDFALVSGGAWHPPRPGDPPDAYLERWRGGEGPYTTNGAVLSVIAKSHPDLDVPDLFLFALPANFHGYYPGYSTDLERAANRLTWAILKAHTVNHAGTVTLRTTDPRDVPDIRFRYFEEGSDPAGKDLDAVVAGVRLARRITARLRDWGAHEVAPGESVQTADQLRTWIRDNAWGHHACGTCAMGPDGSPTAVLDSKFRVRGVPGLRVVDASVFPRIPGYFIVTPTYMISEKAADDIAAAAEATGRSSERDWPGSPAVGSSEMRMS